MFGICFAPAIFLFLFQLPNHLIKIRIYLLSLVKNLIFTKGFFISFVS